MDSKQSKHLYEFGPFHLYPAEGLLLRNGDSVRLTPKAFETLLLLVTNQGRVLDKHELMEKIWPDTFVEEVNLAKNISSLRRILGEGDSKELFIETLPKRGYRFVAPVREYSAPVPETANAPTNGDLEGSGTATESQPLDLAPTSVVEET